MTRSADYEKGYLAGGGEDSDSGSEHSVIDVDENSPLLLDLDPPGTNTTRASYMGDDWGGGKKGRKKSLPNFGIRKKKEERLPWVIVITAVGMAAMVLVGFITMFQDTGSVTNFTNTVEASSVGNVAGVPSVPSTIPDGVSLHELNFNDKNGVENLIVSSNSII